MKKKFLTLTVIAGTFTFAQDISNNTSKPVRFGIKAGLNVSNLSDNSLNSKAGFYGGILANVPVTRNFSIQPEVLYNGVGAKSKSNSDVKFNLDYIAVPVMLQYNVLNNLYLEAGPQFSFLINAKVKNNVTSLDVKDVSNSFDFGLGLGAGYYFTSKIGMNVRYVGGLSDIVKNRPSTSDYVRNGVFQVGLVYKF